MVVECGPSSLMQLGMETQLSPLGEGDSSNEAGMERPLGAQCARDRKQMGEDPSWSDHERWVLRVNQRSIVLLDFIEKYKIKDKIIKD